MTDRAGRWVCEQVGRLGRTVVSRRADRSFQEPDPARRRRSGRHPLGQLSDDPVTPQHREGDPHVAHVSERTVKGHISGIFTKLGVRDRAAAIICAYDAGLVNPGG